MLATLKSFLFVRNFQLLNRIKPKSEFSQNVLTLMTGTTIAQAIPIVISPILTHIYTPESFGVFAIYISIVSIISVIATGRYETAIMHPKKDEDAINILVLSIVISFFISLISLMLVFIFNTNITNILNNQEISAWLYLIPISVLLTGIYQSFNYWSNRKKKYRRLATNKVVQSTTTVTSNIAIGLNSSSASGLIIGQILGQSISVSILGKLIWKEDKSIFHYIKKKKIIFLAYKYIQYPKKSAVGAFFNAIANQAEILLLGIFYSSHFLGLFYFVSRFVNIPKQFLSSSIWQVFLSNTGHDIKDVFNAKYFKQKKIILYTTFPIIYGIFIYPDLFVFIFNETWKEATKFILPLIIAMHINFIVASFSLFTIINRPDAEMKFNIYLAFFKVFSILTSHFIWHDIFYTILSFSIVQSIMFYILGSWNYNQLGKNYFFFTKLYTPYFLVSIVLLLISELLFSELSLALKNGIYLVVIGSYFGVIKYAKI
jgi:O-antigen/teichoic acid export membrane protein